LNFLNQAMTMHKILLFLLLCSICSYAQKQINSVKPDSVRRLKEVSIVGQKRLVTQEIDRLSYNVQADPEVRSLNALDMIRKVPMVSLDANDELQINGNGGLRILVNGKPSSLANRNPKDMLRNMSASNIQKIEVITTPSSGNDAEGGAGGTINIITFRRSAPGYTGNLGVAINSLGDKRSNGSVTISNGRFVATVDAAYSRQESPVMNTQNFRLSLPVLSRIEQAGEVRNSSKLYYGNLDLSYEIDSLRLVSGFLGFNSTTKRRSAEELFSEVDALGALRYAYLLNNQIYSRANGTDLGLSYQLGFSGQKDKLLTASYKYSAFRSVLENQNTFSPIVNYNGDVTTQDDQLGLREQTLQTDYVQPFKKVLLEMGAKLVLRRSFSDFVNSDSNADPGNLDYNQQIYAVYQSAQFKLGGLFIRTGLRLERTVIVAHFQGFTRVLKKNYNNLVPSISAQWKLRYNQKITFGYTQRVQRPAISQLNPFVDQSNPLFHIRGNPALSPVLHHSLDLSYTNLKTLSMVIGLSDVFANNTIQNIVTLGSGNVAMLSYANIGKINNLSVYTSLGYTWLSKLNLSLNGRISYFTISGKVGDVFQSNSAVQGNVFTSLAYKLPADWRTTLTMGAYSKSISLQGSFNSYQFCSLSVGKELLGKKLSVSGAVNNPFQEFRNQLNRLTTAQFIQEANTQSRYRRFDLNVSYKFGRLKPPIQKIKKRIENDDLKGYQ
jgi:outer membrane receptor protein involved in Fe transport